MLHYTVKNTHKTSKSKQTSILLAAAIFVCSPRARRRAQRTIQLSPLWYNEDILRERTTFTFVDAFLPFLGTRTTTTTTTTTTSSP
jgi:hypothetical protein